MTESSLSNRILNGVLIASAIYFVSLTVFLIATMDIGFGAIQWYGMWWSKSDMQEIARSVSYGLCLGQLACLGLWFNLSDRRFTSKCKMYLWFAAQLFAAMCFLFSDVTLWSSLHFIGIVVAVPMLIALGLRWSSNRIHLVDLEDRSQPRSKVGITLVQAICATAAIAFCLVTYDIASQTRDTYSGLLCFIVYWAGASSVLSVAGLIAALQIKRLITPLLLSVLAILIAIVVRLQIQDLTILNYWLCLVWPALLPMVFVWLAPQFGFVVEPQNSRKPTKEHQPLLGDSDPFAIDATTEPELR